MGYFKIYSNSFAQQFIVTSAQPHRFTFTQVDVSQDDWNHPLNNYGLFEMPFSYFIACTRTGTGSWMLWTVSCWTLYSNDGINYRTFSALPHHVGTASDKTVWYTTPNTYIVFIIHIIKILQGLAYWAVLCYHPFLVFLPSAVLLSLHRVTFFY